MANLSLTWLGHASFRLDGPSGKRVYIDPWLENPKCPEGEREVEKVDVVALTHAHIDHVASCPELVKQHSPDIVCMIEYGDWLESQGFENVHGINKGGTVDLDGVRVTMTDARHSSGRSDGGYGGEAAGVVVELDDIRIYHAGDTCVFGDMQLISRLYQPDVAILPIGGYFTMDPREAAVALELLDVKRCVPCHYGTFPALSGTPDELRKLAPAGVEIIAPDPGETIQL
jgi:L-ascorbate metabolism protein UlaG (beta-lactamase superfamily)